MRACACACAWAWAWAWAYVGDRGGRNEARCHAKMRAVRARCGDVRARGEKAAARGSPLFSATRPEAGKRRTSTRHCCACCHCVAVANGQAPEHSRQG